jgi:excisionase family DNA binding protein
MAVLLDLPTLLTPAEVAAQLRVSVGTLAVWRCTKRYPLKFLKIGHAVRYRAADVEEFLRQGTSR